MIHPRLLIAALLLAAPALALAQDRTVTDATGRAVSVPAAPARVFAAGPPAATLLYTLKPDAMVGWVRAPTPEDLRFLRPEAAALPQLGMLTGRGDTLNLEVLLSARPDLIVDYGTVDATYVDLASRIQDQTGLPYVLVDGSLADLPGGIRRMADLLAVPDRGETLAAYAERTLADLDALLAGIPQDARPTVYLARGPEGLETAAKGSINAEIIERAGAINVAEAGTRGLATVSPEQVQAWAPEVIITIDRDFAAKVGRMPEWQGIPAVANGRVYLAPAAPFGFIDRPPSVNRLIGLRWLAHKLYPDAATGDLRAEVAAFYDLFYGLRPDDAALTALLGE
ncbi:iron ABC transporter substrate-binding protein [Paracoccus sp. S3-43]|uniref:iron ABC transporter substrate-binding protein n=1 Tax=Paracoccus sp. S3-43 TaxID=3030011 RepID=UPI0023B1EF41|nr:iron ABC transporter substrate-binding protein [Paracoccus sp. S3-43]WEF25581.1 iron ABC transporter substrate-binding protein [Paracoccus sp. S3-43]